MINTVNRVPSAYIDNSRDFQVLGHLFDGAFNSSRLPIDTMLNNQGTKNLDYRFLTLACRTLGFNVDGNYTANELSNVVQSFKTIIQDKGNKKGIQEAIKMTLNAQGISEGSYVLFSNSSNEDTCELEIYLPDDTKSTRLLEEIFDYILPCGWTYSIAIRSTSQLEDIYFDKVKIKHHYRVKKSKINGKEVFGTSWVELSTLNYIKYSDTKNIDLYSYTITNSNLINENSKILVDIYVDKTKTAKEIESIKKNWSKIYRAEVDGASIYLYAKEQINEDLTLNVLIDNSIENESTIKDSVETYADLLTYDTSNLTTRDIIKVMKDETKNNNVSYYKYARENAESLVADIDDENYYLVAEDSIGIEVNSKFDYLKTDIQEITQTVKVNDWYYNETLNIEKTISDLDYLGQVPPEDSLHVNLNDVMTGPAINTGVVMSKGKEVEKDGK